MKLTLAIVIAFYISIFPQLFDRDEKELFKKIQLDKLDQPNDSVFNFPLNNGDFTEYIQQDAYIRFYEGLNNTVIKEVINDTLMLNGLTYKIIKTYKTSNTNQDAPVFEFLRKDSNKVFIYNDGKDVVLYDFNKLKGESYLTFNNHTCYVDDIYLASNEYGVLIVYDFRIVSPTSARVETILEDFGMVSYMGDLNLNSNLPKGNSYGFKINDTLHNYPLAKGQPIDWNEYYPLQTGNYWVYNSSFNNLTSIITSRVIGDTVMTDGNTYKIIINEEIGGSTKSKTIKYEMFDIPYLYEWNSIDSTKMLKLIFTSVVGDTFNIYNKYTKRMNSKGTGILEFIQYPDTNLTENYGKGFGLIRSTNSGGMKMIRGAYINGVLYGDTTVLGINEEIQNSPNEFYLAQNYPNPFNPSTTISFIIPQAGYAKIKVFNTLGEEVKTLLNEYKQAGSHEVTFNGTDLTSGVYIYQLSANGKTYSKKMVLMK